MKNRWGYEPSYVSFYNIILQASVETKYVVYEQEAVILMNYTKYCINSELPNMKCILYL